MLVALTAVLLAAGAPPCDGRGDGAGLSLAAAVPRLASSGALPAKFWKGAHVLDLSEALEVDERVVRFALVGEKPLPATRLPLALPSPWVGTLDVAPRGGELCSAAEVTLFDGELRRAAFSALPVDVTVTFTRKGVAPRTRTFPHDTFVVGPRFIEVGSEGASPVRLWLGAAPDVDALFADGAGSYVKFLDALGGDVLDDIRKSPSPDAQRVLFAEAAASWRQDLGSWLPRSRIDTIARFDERLLASAGADARALLRFWKQELSPGKIAVGAGEASARLIIDDAVTAVWIEGVEVFDRAKGMPTSVEIRPPKTAVRTWIVSRSNSGKEVVHDTRAVMRAGEIYAVTSTFVQHARGGARRECIRVVGELPFDADLLWREISNAPPTRPGPMLGVTEAYRPSVPSAERALTVVPGGSTRPFPPVPLVYSYTHPGLYRWTLAKDGSVKLELVDDAGSCAQR